MNHPEQDNKKMQIQVLIWRDLALSDCVIKIDAVGLAVYYPCFGSKPHLIERIYPEWSFEWGRGVSE
jgi:hypothetical protein